MMLFKGPVRPPRGARRWLLRLPTAAYRVRLGWLFGRRLVLVEHTGRRSGQARQVVLEVVEHDPTGAVTVASGFVARSDWYRNLLAEPQTHITIGRRRYPVVAHRVDAQQGAEIMTAYARRHRTAARQVARFMGHEVNGSDADFARTGTTAAVPAPGARDQHDRKPLTTWTDVLDDAERRRLDRNRRVVRGRRSEPDTKPGTSSGPPPRLLVIIVEAVAGTTGSLLSGPRGGNRGGLTVTAVATGWWLARCSRARSARPTTR